MPFKPGQSGNPSGRKKGSKNKKTLLLQELEKDGSALALAIKAKALEGDTAAQALWLSRVEPAMRTRGEHVEFDFDPKASPAQQIEAVTQAVANGELTLEQGKQMVEMIGRLAEVRALDSGDDRAQKLIDAFKFAAQSVDRVTLPYHPPGSAEPSGPNAPPQAPPRDK